MSTTYNDKTTILADLWMNYRQDEEFTDFVEYNDLGLPLAYLIDNSIVESSPLAEKFINETFELLLGALNVEDNGYESMDDLLTSAE